MTTTDMETDSGSWGELLTGGSAPRFAMVLLGVWLTAVDSLVTSTIMPTVGADLGGYALFGWAVAGFFVGVVLASASAGRLSEIFGLGRATVMSALLFAAGCALSAIAWNMPVFLLGRLVQGIGSGWIAGFAMVAVGALFAEKHLARVFASVTAVWGIATLLGPLVGGVFAEAGNWRGVFWFFVVQALAFGVLAAVLLRGESQPKKESRIPWLQLAVLALAVSAAAAANIVGNVWVAAGMTLLGGALCLFVLGIERSSSVTLLPAATFRLRTVGSGYLAMFALTAALTGLLAYGPAVLQELHGLSPLQAGYAVAVQTFTWTACAFWVAGTPPGGGRGWIRAGGILVLSGLVLLAAFTSNAPLPLFLLAAAVMGAGFGLSSSLMNRRVLGVLGEGDRATGSSALIAVRQTGGAFGAAVAGTTANLAGFGSGLTLQTAQATGLWVFVTAIPFAAMGAWAAWRMAAKNADG